jgi:hypothetical protein
MIKVKEMTGRGILFSEGQKFLVLSAQEAGDEFKPETGYPILYVAEQVSVEDDGLLFRNPAWITLFGSGAIRWFPKHRKVQVEIVDGN